MRGWLTTKRAILLTFLLIAAACDLDNSHARSPVDDTGRREYEKVGQISDDRIREASGIVASRRYPGVFWTHNDGGDGVLFAIRRDGSFIGCAKLDVKVRDWEDIALDEDNNICVADTGNNSENRKHIVIVQFPEPDPATLKQRDPDKIESTSLTKVWYPDKPFNGESLLFLRGQPYVISKVPEGGRAGVYRIDDANRKGSMTHVITLPIDHPVTAADVSPDTKHLAVLTRGALWLFEIEGDIARAEHVKPTHVRLPPLQTEGCCFANGEILIVAETGELFAIPFAGASPSTQPNKP